MKVCIRTVGCRTNKADSDLMAETLSRRGLAVVSDINLADVVVVNSCTVTAAADRDTRQQAYRARRAGAGPLVFVTGCLVSAQGAEADWTGAGIELVADRMALVDRLTAMAGPTDREEQPISGPDQRVRAYVKIQEGCEQRCTYCIVPDARGLPRSQPAGEVLGELERVVSRGWKDVVLTGTHVGLWGRDLSPATDLPDLIRRISARDLPARFRLSSLEPQDCTPELLAALFEAGTRFCPHLHLPLQSGSDSILRKMGRPYNTGFFAELVQRVREVLGPDLCIGVDLISGFPGETPEDYTRTVEFLRGLEISYIHAFTYSARPGTPAADMGDQVDPDLRRERTTGIRRIGEEKLTRFMNRMLGREMTGIVEGASGDGIHLRVLTGNYLRGLVADCPPEMKSRWIRFRVDAIKGGRLIGAFTGPTEGL